MTVTLLAVSDAVEQLDQFDAVIDARSPAEFAEDHLPGALNWPVLDDDERRIVGTLYVQQGPLAARKVGGPLVARRIAGHIERELADKPREWRPLVYCWRGGQRSGTLAWFLWQVGFRSTQLAGGYRAFRGLVRKDLETLPARHHYTVLAGRTGSGKTRLLQALAALPAQGAQVLDLEALAQHRGSILGGLPGQPQPSQKRFDTLLWQALRGFDAQREVFVESESQRIGRLRVPDALLLRMREHSRCLMVELPDDERVRLLLQDYAFFADDPAHFCRLLEGLIELRGRVLVQRWQAMAVAGQWAAVFGELMRDHYDPLYTRSLTRNFPHLAQAQSLPLQGVDATSMAQGAQMLLGMAAAGAAA